jgi:hypothetical protein
MVERFETVPGICLALLVFTLDVDYKMLVAVAHRLEA